TWPDGSKTIVKTTGADVTVQAIDKKGNTVKVTLVQADLNAMLGNSAFMTGMDKKKGDYKKFTNCSNAPLNKPGISAAEIIAAFQSVATTNTADFGKIKDALKKYQDAVNKWNAGDYTKAGETMAGALKKLAEAVGC
ncbi:MAG: hypothetical protein D6771_04745, partial [Zetaproteobacteria bacterium]